LRGDGKPMATLHTVNKTLARGDALARCARFAAPGDTVLLIEDGVYAGLPHGECAERVQPLLEACRVCALLADARARGIESRLPARIERVDDAGFVALAAGHERVVSWV